MRLASSSRRARFGRLQRFIWRLSPNLVLIIYSTTTAAPFTSPCSGTPHSTILNKSSLQHLQQCAPHEGANPHL
ncbi:hypothetical protein BJ165DRAFT_1492802 [Panaeolus papilionaceus]|nr:hypothetical protein BJ165DRAFT_1492802 [Panaeolus papilionaceus]